jgi:hypothetical protein
MIAMVWDLRGALLKKEERESARLMDFAFRLRARTWRLIAEALDDDAEQAARLTAKHDDEGLFALLAQRHPHRAADLTTLYRDCEAAARKQLIAERGDPSPYRLL